MRPVTYLGRSLAFYWRSHLPVVLGVVTATAALTGALLVGDSMRASLGEVALNRLGRVDHALVAPRFFDQGVADGLAGKAAVTQACAAIILSGGAVNADTGSRVNRVTILGADDRFWKLAAPADGDAPTMPTGRSVILNEPLASQLAVGPGHDVLLRIGKPGPVSTETLLGRRDETARTLRLTVSSIVSAERGGTFALEPGRSPPNNAWIPLLTLQRALDQPGLVDAILVETAAATEDSLQDSLRTRLELGDLGLRLRPDPDRAYVALEADSILIEPAVENAALAAAEAIGATASPLLTYLANTIEAEPTGGPTANDTAHAAIPYSTVTALDTAVPAAPPLRLLDGSPVPALEPGDLLLNRWAADDLGVKPGDRVSLTYYVTGSFGRLDTRRASFVLRGVVDLDPAAADAGFAPPYRGLTDADNLADWDPPFPVDLNRVRDRDEDYWDRYRTAPKAFVSLAEGRRLWADETARFGASTSIRITCPGQTDLTTLADDFGRELPRHLDVAHLGFSFQPVRQRALVASTGTTDFGVLFVSFSSFLIAAAAMLIALLFGLGAERRAAEIGTLLATGFAPGRVAWLLVVEGGLVACVGAVLGSGAAVGYAWLMLAGLKSWWAGAVNAPFLQLHVPPTTLVIGFCASMVIAVAAIAWSVRRLSRSSTRSLLAGAAGSDTFIAPRRRHRVTAGVGLVALLAAALLVVLSALTEAVPQTAGFFSGGAALVVACLCGLRIWLRMHRRAFVQRPGPGALLRLGARNAPRHPGRSLLAAGLIASSTFIIAATGALRLDFDDDTTSRQSSTGGFALLAESAIPLPYDLSTPQGRAALGLARPDAELFDRLTVMPFRLRPGDESSCRGLFRPTSPRIIAATDRLIDRGGFVFAATLAETEDEKQHPWTLLRRTFPDGAVPVIGDQSAVKWQYHLDLGRDFIVTDERGQEVPLRFVALLAGSVLQDELIVAESRFVRLFPSIAGHAFFLLDAPLTDAPELSATLEGELGRFALDVTPTTQRLAAYFAVQNTYLRTFQTLGGLGLVLGTVGLVVVLLRNVSERRGELALMRALGFSTAAVGRMVLAENALLVVAGLAAGAVPALIAIAPHLLAQPAQVPWLSLGLTLLGVLAVGLGAGVLAVALTLKAPILPALRTE